MGYITRVPSAAGPMVRALFISVHLNASLIFLCHKFTGWKNKPYISWEQPTDFRTEVKLTVIGCGITYL